MSTNMRFRDASLDILRCFALFCVICVHFFRNSGFYSIYIVGSRVYFMTLLRCGFMICVPLFILLTGSLMNKKALSHTYYTGLIKTLIIYLLASICCFSFDTYYTGKDYNISEFFSNLILGIFDYSAAPYGWYIGMYIGLFLMIPFLNVLYNNLQTKQNKQFLILILLIITAPKSISDLHLFATRQWWLDSRTIDTYSIFPTWWESCYPLTYYFLGAYFKEYPLKIKPKTNFFLIVTVWFITGSFRFYCCDGGEFLDNPFPYYNSLAIITLSSLVFIFITQADYHFLNNTVKRILARISDLCLGAYLVSSIFDTIFYDILNQHQSSVSYRFNYFPLIVSAVYICSLILSAVLNSAYRFFFKRFLHLTTQKVH